MITGGWSLGVGGAFVQQLLQQRLSSRHLQLCTVTMWERIRELYYIILNHHMPIRFDKKILLNIIVHAK